MSRLALTAIFALLGCSPADDGASGRRKLVGTYVLVVPSDQAAGRKDLVASTLRLSRDGMFTQQCRYKSGKSDSAIGTWSYANQRAQFSIFKDCARVMGKRDSGASLPVDFDTPTRIMLVSNSNIRYERRGPP